MMSKRLSCPLHGEAPVGMVNVPGSDYREHAFCWICFYEKIRTELPPLDLVDEPDKKFEHEERQRAWRWPFR